MAKGYQKLIERELKNAGWELKRRPAGSHAIWTDGSKCVPVPHRLNDRNMAKHVMREAGLDARLVP